ncbi:MAG: hypothetical protein J0L71_13065 [Candidatus Accumulibacter sp.]|nr:hypothetical protein [Accumulibacter sp.]MBN8518763.1 hypothetical protein [Accumulibacter sp.]
MRDTLQADLKPEQQDQQYQDNQTKQQKWRQDLLGQRQLHGLSPKR